VAKLSVVIPSRNEPYLNRTIDDIFANARGEIEVVVALDGYWPDQWKEMTARYPNLHSVHSGEAIGMRAGINRAVASAASRGARYVMKLDAHCALSEGFDVTLLSEIESNWVVIPRRGRLDPEKWCATETHKPDIDYHYLSFPDNPSDFGGKELNGKVWNQRAVERKDILLDDECSSQGSCWLMATNYFYQLELMDEANYSRFWAEAQEIMLKCWLSGGKCVVNKKATYLHWHKGKTGRGYRLPESWLQQGASFTRRWLTDSAWTKQTKPLRWLIEKFSPMPTWPNDLDKAFWEFHRAASS